MYAQPMSNLDIIRQSSLDRSEKSVIISYGGHMEILKIFKL